MLEVYNWSGFEKPKARAIELAVPVTDDIVWAIAPMMGTLFICPKPADTFAKEVEIVPPCSDVPSDPLAEAGIIGAAVVGNTN